MINIVYIEKDEDYSQESCDEYCHLMINTIRQRNEQLYVTNTSAIAKGEFGGYAMLLSVGRVLGEKELTLPDETLFIIRSDVQYDFGNCAAIDKIVIDGGFGLDTAIGYAFDGDNGCTSFTFAGGGIYKAMVANCDLWHTMPEADPVWEEYIC